MTDDNNDKTQGAGDSPMISSGLHFKARIECSLLRGIATSFSAMTDDVKMVIGKSKWIIKAVDPAHVAMMHMEIDTNNFEEYNCMEEGSLGIDMGRLLEAVQYAKDRDIVDIRVEHSKGRIIIDSGVFQTRFDQVDTTGWSDPKMPSLNLPVTYAMNWADFQGILKRMNKVSDHIEIKAHPDGLEFIAENDYGNCIATLGQKSLVEYRLDDSKKLEIPIASLFPLDYLMLPFTNSVKTGCKPLFNHERWLNVVKFRIGQDYPIHMSAERNGVLLEYFIAPRIESR